MQIGGVLVAAKPMIDSASYAMQNSGGDPATGLNLFISGVDNRYNVLQGHWDGVGAAVGGAVIILIGRVIKKGL